MSYKTFKRSARNFEKFAKARKYIDWTGLTIEAARQKCKYWNDHQSSAQINRGTKMEFTKE